MFVIIFLVLAAITHNSATAKNNCLEHSDCQTDDGFESGVCYYGACTCHPSYYPPYCRTVAQFDEPHGRKMFELVYEEVTWKEAELNCRKRLGTLGQIENQKQNDFLARAINSRVEDYHGLANSDLFLGLTASAGSSRWQWSDGSDYIPGTSFQSWDSPGEGSGDGYVVVGRRGVWSAVDADARHGYICQYDSIDEYELKLSKEEYFSAEKECRDAGMGVVSITDASVLKYVTALYSVNSVTSGWVGLYFDSETYDWRWTDGSAANETLLRGRINSRPSYDLTKRAEMIVQSDTRFVVVDGSTTAIPYICKTAKVKRDCGVLRDFDDTLPSASQYYIRPKYANYMAYCDMATDGGGYTYYITPTLSGYSVYDTHAIQRLCRDFQPVDIQTPGQVLELKRILEDEGYDLETGVVPIAVFTGGRYHTLHSRYDISWLLASLELDYNEGVAQYNSRRDEVEGTMLGIGYGNTLTSFYPRDRDKGKINVLAAVCSTNNKQGPLETFSLQYTHLSEYDSHNNILSHHIEREVVLTRGTVCVWLSTPYASESIVFSLASKSKSVTLQLVVSPYDDHFKINGYRTLPGVDFGILDGSYHRVCMAITDVGYEVVVDGVQVTSEEHQFGDINLAGSFTIGTNLNLEDLSKQFLGAVDSVDVWDYLPQDLYQQLASPLYMPGNVVRWSDFYSDVADDVIQPAVVFGYSRFKVGVGPSGLRWSKNYCLSRKGQLGAPRNDHEYMQIVKLLQGNSGWIAVSRANNTLSPLTELPQNISLTYVPTEGQDGQLSINGDGDLETRTVNDLLSFVCQFDVPEERPAVQQECPPEETETKKGRFSWVKAVVTGTVKVTCPHGTIDAAEGGQGGYASRVCLPSPNTTDGVWDSYNLSPCNYANLLTQQIENLRKVSVTEENAEEVAGMILSITNDSKQLDDLGVSLVTGIIEDLVAVKNKNATAQITHTLSNIMEVDPEVLSISQKNDKAADRIVLSLETVAGTLAENSTQQRLLTKNIEINAVLASSDQTATLRSEGGAAIDIPPATADNKPVYLITYSTDKLFMTGVMSQAAAESQHSNISEDSRPFINTPIISAGVDGSSISQLQQPVKLVLPALVKEAGRAQCVYYSEGAWLSDGLQTHYDNTTGHVTCLSDHMTSFAVIMTIEAETHPLEGLHHVVMSTIAYICLFISMVGLVLTIFALSLQRSLWRMDMTKIHVYLSVALFVGYAVFLIGIDQTQSRLVCLTSAFLMHLAFLIAFMWMAVEAYSLYLQFVKVFPSYTPNFIPKCMIVVFSLPLATAGGFLVAGLTTDVKTFYEIEKYCWIKSYTLYYGFILPILLIITCNILIFAYVTRNICRIVRINSEDTRLGQLNVQLRAALSVLVVLGISWIVGAFTFGSASIWFQYCFTILNGLQGFSIFLFHVLLKPEVRKRWYNSIHDITNSISSNSHALKSHSFHRAHKYQVQQLQDRDGVNNNDVNLYNNTSYDSSNNSNKPLLLTDKRFTYLSNSNDYATIESRPSSVSSAVSDNNVSLSGAPCTVPLINHQPATPVLCPAEPTAKRPLSTVASVEPPSPGSQEQGADFAFSPIESPGTWEYNPLVQGEEADPLQATLRDGEAQV